MIRRCFALLAAAALSLPAVAHDYELGKLVINYPWSRPTMAGMSMGVAYLSITNRGQRPDALIAARTPLAESVEIHQTSIVDGMARMRPMSEVPVAAGATVKIEPGGIHLMLVGLKEPLASGKAVPLTLEFREAGSITVQLSVETRDPPAAAENLHPHWGSTTWATNVIGHCTPTRGAPSAPRYRPACSRGRSRTQSGIFWPRVSMTQCMSSRPRMGTMAIMHMVRT